MLKRLIYYLGGLIVLIVILTSCSFLSKPNNINNNTVHENNDSNPADGDDINEDLEPNIDGNDTKEPDNNSSNSLFGFFNK